MTIICFWERERKKEEKKGRKAVLDCNKVFIVLSSSHCLSNSSKTVSAASFNELSWEGSFALEEEDTQNFWVPTEHFD